MIKLMIYAISILASTFAVSGINFDPIIKKEPYLGSKIFVDHFYPMFKLYFSIFFI